MCECNACREAAEGNQMLNQDDQFWMADPAELTANIGHKAEATGDERQQLIAKIVANFWNTFEPLYLMGKPIQELRGLAALAAPSAPVANQAPLGLPKMPRAASAAVRADELVANTRADGPLGLPKMKW